MLAIENIKLKRKINSLENELETLKSAVKDDLFNKISNKINENFELEKIKEENRKLKAQIRNLKKDRNRK